MSDLTVNFARDKGHYRITMEIDGQVEAGAVVACKEGILPVLAHMVATQLEHDQLRRTGKTDARRTPPTITLRGPFGHALIFSLTAVQRRDSDSPEPFLGLREGGGAANPVNAHVYHSPGEAK